MKNELEMREEEVKLLLEYMHKNSEMYLNDRKLLHNQLEDLKRLNEDLNNEIKKLNDIVINYEFELYNKEKKISELTKYNNYNCLPLLFCGQRVDNRS